MKVPHTRPNKIFCLSRMQILAALLHKHIKGIKLEEKIKEEKTNKFGFGEKNI